MQKSKGKAKAKRWRPSLAFLSKVQQERDDLKAAMKKYVDGWAKREEEVNTLLPAINRLRIELAEARSENERIRQLQKELAETKDSMSALLRHADKPQEALAHVNEALAQSRTNPGLVASVLVPLTLMGLADELASMRKRLIDTLGVPGA